jgi:hypothetical protein
MFDYMEGNQEAIETNHSVGDDDKQGEKFAGFLLLSPTVPEGTSHGVSHCHIGGRS